MSLGSAPEYHTYQDSASNGFRSDVTVVFREGHRVHKAKAMGQGRNKRTAEQKAANNLCLAFGLVGDPVAEKPVCEAKASPSQQFYALRDLLDDFMKQQAVAVDRARRVIAELTPTHVKVNPSVKELQAACATIARFYLEQP